MSPAAIFFGLAVFFLLLAIFALFARSTLQERLHKFQYRPKKTINFRVSKLLGVGIKGNINEDELFKSTIFITFIFILVVYVMLVDVVIALVAGAVVLIIFPRAYSKYQITRLQREFNSNLPKATNAITACMQGGSTMLQGFKNAATELPHPVNQEYLKVVEDIENNVPMEEAVFRLADRVGTLEAYLLADSVALIKEVGGGHQAINLLESAASHVREKELIAEKVRANTSYIIMAFAICTAIPYGLSAFMAFTMPEYRVIMSSFYGKIIILVSTVVLGFGWLIVYSIVRSTKEQV